MAINRYGGGAKTNANGLRFEQETILKSMLPFANPKIQMPLAILIESLQIQNTIKLFKNDANLLSACSVNNEPDRKTAMIQTLRKFCTPKEKETIDTLLNIMCVMENYDAFTN